MNTKYSTGQAILIPATISTAEQIDGTIVYHVEADTWNGIPEDAIIVDEKADAQMAMKTFLDSLFGDNRI